MPTVKEARAELGRMKVALEAAQSAVRRAEQAVEAAKKAHEAKMREQARIASLSKAQRANVKIAERLYDASEHWATEWYSCIRKKIFIFKWQAEDACTDPAQGAYTCVWCSGWHLGHPRRHETPLRPNVVRKLSEALDRDAGLI